MGSPHTGNRPPAWGPSQGSLRAWKNHAPSSPSSPSDACGAAERVPPKRDPARREEEKEGTETEDGISASYRDV